jgi:LPXTG-motif cell wall-anchored protein
MRALGVSAVALSGISLTAGFAPSAVAANGCGAGATLISGDVCQVKFTSGSHTFTPPAGTTKLSALIVGAGGAGDGGGWSPISYGGGGGDVKVVALATTGAVSVAVGQVGGDGVAYSSANDSSVAQAGTTTTAAGGRPGFSGNGASGSGFVSPGGFYVDFHNMVGGGGAGAAPTNDTAQHASNGGAGLVVSKITGASTTLFSNDTDCYGGGGGASSFGQLDGNTPGHTNGVATCGGGSGTFTANGQGRYVSHTQVVPRANSGGGGAGISFGDGNNIGTNFFVHQSGAAGVVILRYKAALPDTGMNIGGILGLGASALLAGAAALILVRRRTNA